VHRALPPPPLPGQPIAPIFGWGFWGGCCPLLGPRGPPHSGGGETKVAPPQSYRRCKESRETRPPRVPVTAKPIPICLFSTTTWGHSKKPVPGGGSPSEVRGVPQNPITPANTVFFVFFPPRPQGPRAGGPLDFFWKKKVKNNPPFLFSLGDKGRPNSPLPPYKQTTWTFSNPVLANFGVVL